MNTHEPAAPFTGECVEELTGTLPDSHFQTATAAGATVAWLPPRPTTARHYRAAILKGSYGGILRQVA